MAQQLDTLPPIPPSPTDTVTISWPSENGEEEDRALLRHEVAEAVAEVSQLVAEDQEEERSPLLVTSRDLSPIETGISAGQNSAEEETPTQLFQTPISPSHTVAAYHSLLEVVEPSELPFLTELGETAPEVEAVEERKVVPVMTEDVTTEDRFQPKVEQEVEERFSPTVERETAEIHSLAITRPALVTEGTGVHLRLPTITVPLPPALHHTLLSRLDTASPPEPRVVKPVPKALSRSSENVGLRSAVSPPIGYREDKLRSASPKRADDTERSSHLQQEGVKSSIDHLLVATVGVASSADDSSSDDHIVARPQPPPSLSIPRISPRVATSSRPSPSTRRSASRSQPREPIPRHIARIAPRTTVSSAESRQQPIYSSFTSGRREPTREVPGGDLKPSVLQLVSMIKEKLGEEETFRYVLKGVLAEHEEQRMVREREEAGKWSAEAELKGYGQLRGSKEAVMPTHQVHTDSESDMEAPESAPVRKASPPHSQHQGPTPHALSSFPMTRSPIVPPAAIAHLAEQQHVATLIPRRIDPPPFHDPRDLSVAKKVAKPRDIPSSRRGEAAPPPTSAATAARKGESRARGEKQTEESRKAGEGGRSSISNRTEEARPVYRAEMPRPRPQRRHTAELHQRQEKEQPPVDTSMKISMLGKPGGPQYPDPSMNELPLDKRPLRLSTNDLLPSRALKSAGAVLFKQPSVLKGVDEIRRRRSNSLHVASFDFDDFA